ncbi:putative DNA ligase IV-containing protein [Homarus americanus]|uniref:Putative DNA ligase IV-containing protein n=1 Tax=Homarus americanus TaxID=6706 RepID=A0A8J5JVG2_HOMAM|nr:putative DNA ligase IV-containing protein [Homarus americanus]
MRDLFDIFGDSYTEPANKKSLKRVMDNMKKETNHTFWYFSVIKRSIILHHSCCDFMVALSLTPWTMLLMWFTEKKEHPTPSEMGGRHLVMSDWIYDCVEKGKLFEPRYYVPKLMLD